MTTLKFQRLVIALLLMIYRGMKVPGPLSQQDAKTLNDADYFTSPYARINRRNQKP